MHAPAKQSRHTCYVVKLQYSPTTTSHYHALSRLSTRAPRKELPCATEWLCVAHVHGQHSCAWPRVVINSSLVMYRLAHLKKSRAVAKRHCWHPVCNETMLWGARWWKQGLKLSRFLLLRSRWISITHDHCTNDEWLFCAGSRNSTGLLKGLLAWITSHTWVLCL